MKNSKGSCVKQIFLFPIRVILILLTLLLVFMPKLSPEDAAPLTILSFAALPILIADLLMVIFSHKIWRWIFLLLCLICLPLYGKYIPSWKIYTEDATELPQYIGCDAEVKNSYITQGCMVEGKVENSVLFTNTEVGKKAVVKDTVLMPSAVVEDGAKVTRALVADGVKIGKGAVVGSAKSEEILLVAEDVEGVK